MKLTSEQIKAFDGLEEANRNMDIRRQELAPMCHFREMFYDQSDSTDGHYEEWWECSVCGHTELL